jgi:hypothetical protein
VKPPRLHQHEDRVIQEVLVVKIIKDTEYRLFKAGIGVHRVRTRTGGYVRIKRLVWVVWTPVCGLAICSRMPVERKAALAPTVRSAPYEDS